MNIIELVKMIFDCFVWIAGALFAVFMIVALLTYVPDLAFSGNDSSSKLKRMAMRIVTGLFVIGIAVLVIWAGLLAPKKELVVVEGQVPRFDGSEGTSPGYLVYYVWDGKRERLPWWFIYQAPLEDDSLEWAVLEVADVYDELRVEDVNSFMVAATEAIVKFDKKWFNYGAHRVKRTRFQKVRHVLFGTDNFEKEEKAIEEVLNLIESKRAVRN